MAWRKASCAGCTSALPAGPSFSATVRVAWTDSPAACRSKHEAARRTLIEHYLSLWHRDHAGDGCPVSGFATDLGREPEQAARSQHVYINGVRNRAARLATGDDDGMAQLCTMVGALVLARATRGNPISEELLQAARTALTKSGTGQSAPQHRTN
ncbi:hypothetical protein ACFTY7_17225 [Streptomyces sp. NPDC057062]|uniref:hypothetical protein n=1 Tax=Streptomyces sp. NPDC057062 TaxID=3346011 RepID=UPI0036289B3B